MKRKILSVLLASVMITTLITGCSSTSSTSSNSSTSESSTSTTKEAESTTTETNTASETASESTVEWPSGSSIKFDVPAKAGGGTDLITRYLTTGWDELVDASFVVTNYDTAEVGAQDIKNAKPDGMTLSMAACTNMDNYLAGSSEVNPVEDLTCIAKIVAGGPQVLFTTTDAPYNNLQELKEYAQENPGKVTVGCSLGGTSQLMWVKVVKAMGDIELNYVQCASESDKLSNVAAKSIMLGNCSLNNALQYEADGKIKILAILSYSEEVGKDQIMEGLGDQYLTTWEQGFPDSSWEAGYYVVGPVGMSDDLVETINASVQEATKQIAFLDGMKEMSMVIEAKGMKESQADFLAEYEVQRALTTSAGINTRE
jgi:tripartite-type tricarboxylate transporter receptor subunit TctC